jgi:hypothetical protein
MKLVGMKISIFWDIFTFLGVEWNRVHLLAYSTSYGRLKMKSVEQSVELLAGGTEVLGGNLPNCRFVHHKSQMTRPGLEPGPPRWEASD